MQVTRVLGLQGKQVSLRVLAKQGLKKKNQNLFFRAEVLSTAKGHTEELSCAHMCLFLYIGSCLSSGQLESVLV